MPMMAEGSQILCFFSKSQIIGKSFSVRSEFFWNKKLLELLMHKKGGF